MSQLRDFMAQRYWKFFRIGGSTASIKLKFEHDGTISGYNHHNEKYWLTKEDSITLMNNEEVPTCILKITSAKDDVIVLKGSSLVAEDQVELCLESQPLYFDPNAPASTREDLSDHIAAFGWDIGDYTYGRPDIIEPHMGILKIGRFCSIAAQVTIIMGNHNYKYATTYPFGTLRHQWPETPAHIASHIGKVGVTIGHDVWLGKGSYIMPGVTIGNGAIVGANSVVTRNIPDYAIYAGTPANLVRYRFDEHQIKRLLEIQWWFWTRERIVNSMSLLLSEEIDKLIAEHSNI